jgi:CHAT domain-containing protein/Flp pilus assembly protein TadD
LISRGSGVGSIKGCDMRFTRCVVGLFVLGFLVTLPRAKVAAQSDPLRIAHQQCMASVKQGRYVKAEPFCLKAAKLGEAKFGPEHKYTGTFLNNLAVLYRNQGRFDDAEPLFKRYLEIGEKALGPNHPNVAQALNNLGALYKSQGRYSDAEPLYKRSLEIREKALGPNHPKVAETLNNLAILYLLQGRYRDTEPLYKRSLEIREKALGPTHRHVATGLNNLADLYRRQGRYDDAEPLQKRSLEITEKALGPNHPEVATGLNNLANIYKVQGRFSDAAPLYERSLEINEKVLGPTHPRVASGLNTLAELYQWQGRYDDAEPLQKRSLEITEKALGPNHPNVAESLASLAGLYRARGQESKALGLYRRTTAIYRDRASQPSGHTTGGLSEQKLRRGSFGAHVDAAFAIARNKTSMRVSVTAETFSVGQLARTTQAGSAVSRMAARFAAGNDNLAKTVREHQDAIALWQRLDADLIKVVSSPPKSRNPAREKALRERLSSIDAKVTTLTKKLATEFPEYAELAAAKSIPLEDVQKLLPPKEALIAYLVSYKKTYVWVVRQNRTEMFAADLGKEALQDAVAELRGGLDPAGISDITDLPPFDRSAAHKLFKQIFAPAEKLLEGARHVFIVPDGALQSLPLGVLVTDEPKGEFKDFSGYRQVPWLAKKYAMTTLPSVSSLRALRTFAKRAKADIPFMGFGDPLLKGHPGGMRGISIPALYKVKSQKELSLADTSAVRNLPPLPETAGELRALSAAVKGDEKYIYLRKAATERTVKSIDLSNTRIITFATHGLVAGDLKNAEPALVLTPPAKGTALDDGLLTSSEVAQLKLNADLVILSACNTAAGDKADGAEGLSGLAKAFFYAGSRALLVSHWPVVSDAAVKLTTGMLKVDPAVGRAEALRRSMLALMNSKDKPHYAHPLFWAPFVVVGEGGVYSAK